MRFLDWNGTGGIDAQDIATSVALDERDSGGEEEAKREKPIEANSGCATMLAVMAIVVLAILLVL